MFKFKIVLIALLLYSSLLAVAQQDCKVNFTGRVFDASGHKEMPFAYIYFNGLKMSTQTDESGFFSLSVPCNTILNLQIQQLDYQTLTKEVRVNAKDFKQDFYLTEKNEVLNTVTVHAHREKTTLTTNSKESITAQELKKLKGKSFSEAASELPGVYNIKTGPGINKPMISGLYGTRIQVINNEVAQMGQQWGVDHAPEIDPFLANNISVVKGASAIKYGPRAIGGALLLEPEQLQADSSLHGSIDLVGFSNGRGGAAAGMLEGSVFMSNEQELCWRVQSSAKKSGDKRTPDYNLTNTGSEELNYSLSSHYSNKDLEAELFYSRFSSEIGILRGAHIGNVDNFFEALDRRPPFFTEDFSYEINNPKQAVDHHLVKSKLHYDVDNGDSFEFIYSYQQNNRQEFDNRRGGRSEIPSVNLRLSSHLAKFNYQHQPVFKILSGELGIDYEYQNNINIAGTGVEPLIPNYSSVQTGAFVSEQYVQDFYSLEIGLRADFISYDVLRFNRQNMLVNPTHEYLTTAAILGAKFTLKKGIVLRSNVSISERAPNINELYSQGLHHSVAAIEEGDDQLKKETSAKWNTNLALNFNEKFKLKVNGYVNHFSNYIYLQPEEPRLTIRGAFPVYSYKQTDAVLYGFDYQLRYELFHHFSLMSKGAVVRGNDLDNAIPLIFMPADRLDVGINWNIRDRLGFDQIDLDFNTSKVFKQFRAPVTETEAYDRGVVPVPDGYFLTNASVGVLKRINGNSLSISLNVYNLMDVSYTDYLNRLRFYAEEPGRNIELKLNYLF